MRSVVAQEDSVKCAKYLDERIKPDMKKSPAPRNRSSSRITLRTQTQIRLTLPDASDLIADLDQLEMEAMRDEIELNSQVYEQQIDVAMNRILTVARQSGILHFVSRCIDGVKQSEKERKAAIIAENEEMRTKLGIEKKQREESESQLATIKDMIE